MVVQTFQGPSLLIFALAQPASKVQGFQEKEAVRSFAKLPILLTGHLEVFHPRHRQPEVQFVASTFFSFFAKLDKQFLPFKKRHSKFVHPYSVIFIYHLSCNEIMMGICLRQG